MVLGGSAVYSMPSVKNIFQKQLSLTYDPQLFLWIFLAANSFLSYGPAGFQTKGWVGVMGIFLPWALALYIAKPLKAGTFQAAQQGFPAALPAWFWVGFWLLAAFLRLVWLKTLLVWPMWDDAACSYYSIGQMQQWHWKLFYSSESLPPLFFWLLSLFYRFFSPSLSALWLFPAVLSILALGTGYWACRRFFQGPFSFFFTFILAFSFWPLFVGSFCQIMVLFLVWELLCLGLFGWYLHSTLEKSKGLTALGLGLGLGLGFYIWVLALPVIALLTAGFLWAVWNEKSERFRVLAAFAVPLLLLALPVSVGIFHNLMGGHVHSYLISGQDLSSRQWLVSASYLTTLLWGPLDKSYFNFGPLWGGYFNPLLGSVFLLGLVELFRFQRKIIFFGALGLLGLGVLPGVVSKTSEMMRILPILPLAVALAALGWMRWVLSFSKNRRIMALSLSAILSLGLDLYHLGGPYHQWAVPLQYSAGSKSPEHYKAYQIIESWRKDKGEGLVFSDFYYDVFDQSLFVTTYGFNAAANPRLDPSQARWAAVVVASWDRAELGKRFPDAAFYDLSEGIPGAEGRMWMALIPVTDGNRRTLILWTEVHREVQGLFAQYPYHIDNPSYRPILARLWDLYRQVPGDVFLRRCLMEKIVDCASKSVDLSEAQPLVDMPLEELWAPDSFGDEYALVFHRMGVLYSLTSKPERARKCFLRAAHFNRHYPLAAMLSRLER
jgi:hypothetical protein